MILVHVWPYLSENSTVYFFLFSFFFKKKEEKRKEKERTVKKGISFFSVIDLAKKKKQMAATTPSKKKNSSKKDLVPDVEYAENIAIAKTINTTKTFESYLVRYRDKMLFAENTTPEDA